MKDVFIVAAARTPIGSFGGSLKDYKPGELGACCVTEVLGRAGIDSVEGADAAVLPQEVIVGNVLGAGHGMNIARQVCLGANLPVSTPAYTVNKVCGSGLKTVALGALGVASGEYSAVLCGGVEVMSQTAFASLGTRWGAKMGHQELLDLMIRDGLTDCFADCHMGITAENLAERFEISREEQDAFALSSQQKALAAREAGMFDEENFSVPLLKRRKVIGEFSKDEYPRDTDLEKLSGLRPAFKRDGTVTAGNASGINDGAAFLFLADHDTIQRLPSSPLARIVGWASGGVEPEVMGLGPVEATQRLLKKTGVALSDIDCIESNEAFAAQALAVQRELELEPDKVNSLGGAIALGHPIGASGARILVTLLYRLKRSEGKYGLATLCVGGGQGVSVLIERC